MNSPAHDVALYLEANGVGALGGTAAWAISHGAEAADPDSVVTVYDTPEGDGGDTDEQDIQHPRFQVRVRAFDRSSAYDKHEEIRTLLAAGAQPKTMSTSLMHIKEAPEIIQIGRDDTNRHILVANYRAMRTAL